MSVRIRVVKHATHNQETHGTDATPDFVEVPEADWDSLKRGDIIRWDEPDFGRDYMKVLPDDAEADAGNWEDGEFQYKTLQEDGEVYVTAMDPEWFNDFDTRPDVKVFRGEEGMLLEDAKARLEGEDPAPELEDELRRLDAGKEVIATSLERGELSPRRSVDAAPRAEGVEAINGGRDYDEREAELEDIVSGEVAEVREMVAGAQGMWMVEFEDGRAALYRPGYAEDDRNNVGATYAVAEAAATDIGKAVGVADAMPATRRETDEFGRTLGTWREGLPELDEAGAQKQVDQLPASVTLFDILIGNSDRHPGHNYALDQDGKGVVFDQGLGLRFLRGNNVQDHDLRDPRASAREMWENRDRDREVGNPWRWRTSTGEEVAAQVDDFDVLRERIEALRPQWKEDKIMGTRHHGFGSPEVLIDAQIDWMLGVVDGLETYS